MTSIHITTIRVICVRVCKRATLNNRKHSFVYYSSTFRWMLLEQLVRSDSSIFLDDHSALHFWRINISSTIPRTLMVFLLRPLSLTHVLTSDYSVSPLHSTQEVHARMIIFWNSTPAPHHNLPDLPVYRTSTTM